MSRRYLFQSISIAAFGCLLTAQTILAQVDHSPTDREQISLSDTVPPGAVAMLGTTRFRSPHVIRNVKFSRNGRWLASVAGRNMVCVWEAATGKRLLLDLGTEIVQPKISFPSHERGIGLMSGSSSGGKFSYWDLPTCKQRWQTKYDVWDFAFSADGSLVATNDRKVSVWEAETGKSIKNYSDVAIAIACAPTQNILASADYDFCTFIDARTGERVRQFTVPDEVIRIWSIAFSPDGNLLAMRTGKMGTILFDTSTGKKVQTIVSQHGAYRRLVFAPDSKTLVVVNTTRQDEGIQIWNYETGRRMQGLNREIKDCHAVSFSADAQQLAVRSRSENVSIWDLDTRCQLRELPIKDVPVAYSPDGETFVAGDGNMLRRWNAASWQPQKSIAHEFPIRSIAFHPAGKQVASVDRGGFVKLWDLPTSKVVATFSGANSVAYTPDGILVSDTDANTASDKHRGALHLWDPDRLIAQKGQSRLAMLSWAPDGSIAACSPGGSYMATSEMHGCVKIWNGSTRDLIHTLRADSISDLAFSTDEEKLAAICHDLQADKNDPTLFVWDTSSGELLHSVDRMTAGIGSCIAFVPKSDLIAIARSEHSYNAGKHDGSIVVLSSATGKTVHDFQLETGFCNALAFSPNGSVMASGGSDGAVTFWSWPQQQRLMRIHCNQGALRAIAFHPNGRYFATGGDDTTILIWDLKKARDLQDSDRTVER
tara:strand:+ start:75830 stop:77959 length:2130 start_codon:yes stop_codon:yes gene_type:complete